MNVEQAFIKSTETGRVVEVAKERLNGRLKDIRLCYQMDVPDSYDEVLADDVKRKIAVSSSKNCWIAIVESKEDLSISLYVYRSCKRKREQLGDSADSE